MATRFQRLLHIFNHARLRYGTVYIVRGNSTAVKTPACGVTGQKFESHLRQSRKNPICLETFSKFLNGRRWGYFQETILSTIYDGEEDTFKKRSYQESASDSPVSLKFDDIWRYRNWNWNWKLKLKLKTGLWGGHVEDDVDCCGTFQGAELTVTRRAAAQRTTKRNVVGNRSEMGYRET